MPDLSADLLIVGGGLSAAALVSSLRRRGFPGDILLASQECYLPYDRPPLSKDPFNAARRSLLEEFGISPSDAAFLLGRRATGLEPLPGSRYRVHFAGTHRPICTPRVVLALGAQPHLPAGWSAPTLSTWRDAERLRALPPGGRLLVVGAGWIGLEVALAARSHGLEVTLLDQLDGPLAHLLPPPLSARIAGWLSGICTHFGSPVSSASATRVTSGNRSFDADLVLAATGASPATDWLPRHWRTPTGHLAVDLEHRVAGGVFAIGDCAAPRGVSSQHWNAAVSSAERLAAVLTGQDPGALAPPSVFSRLAGREIDAVGHLRPGLDVTWREEGESWSALLTREGILLGALCVDRPRDAAAVRRLLSGPAVTLGEAAADPAVRLPGLG